MVGAVFQLSSNAVREVGLEIGLIRDVLISLHLIAVGPITACLSAAGQVRRRRRQKVFPMPPALCLRLDLAR
jgi:hypothetical protein